MADLIERSGIVKVARDAWDTWNLAMATADGQREINKVIKRQELCKAVEAVAKAAPAVDAVPVVRCRDCKWCLYDEEYGKCWCNRVLGAIPVKAADYCSYGNRREAADNG